MASTARIDELKKKFDENPRRYFAPLANEFRKAGDAEQAVMICEEFLPQQPGHMSGHIVYGQALFDLNRLEDARTVFETALTLDPENLIALRHLGDIARTHGDLDSARQWYQRVLEADPRNEEVQALIASLDESPAAAAPNAAAAPAPLEQSTSVDLAPAFEAAAPAPSFESPAAPPPLPHTPPAESLLELDMVEEHALGAPPAVPAPQDPGHTEGFEPMEFSAPSAATTGSSGIEDALEPAEFSAPHASVAPLEGLEETAIGAFEARPADARSAEPPTGQNAPPSLPDFEPASEFAAAAASDEPPVDIPPEVIAAEAELIEAREAANAGAPRESAASVPAAPEPVPTAPDASAAPPAQPASPPRVTPSQPFVTETMAELYVKQGFREQALDVYKLLLAASPENERLRERVAELQPREEVDAGPNVREFFARLAALRPGDQGASAVPPASDDFASLDAFETVPPTSPTTADATYPGSAPSVAPELAGLPMLDDGPPPEREAAAPESPSGEGESAGDGSIDALFGQRPAGQADSSAASALAQAFGSGESDSPPISGRPARAAAGELSLDSVFRDGGARPPRSAQSFSFDQFFSESASADAPAEPGPSPTPSQGTGAQAEPAERGADDIEQFNSWLQGLKQR
jgi:tetratricopeptide (TPR) repeat protein